jgi:single-strand DNA-binding protein
MAHEVTGTVIRIGNTVKVSERFTKRELIVEIADNPKYPQPVQFEASKDRCDLLDKVRVGDEVRIDYDLRGRKWESPQGEVKYFNTLNVWKVEVTKAAPASPVANSDEIPF